MTVSIWQIQYSDDVIIEPDFIPYDCRTNPEWQKREMAHMLRFYEEHFGVRHGADYFGLVSPKFSDKTSIGGRSFINWIDANPGHDVYFINPFPQLCYWHFNVWTQGERWHPGLADLANALFSAAGYSIKVEHLPRNTISTCLYSNYWVGNAKFWGHFMPFVRALVSAVDNLSERDRNAIFSLAPHYAPATYFPFVFERLFSTYLLLNTDINFLSYPYEKSEILSKCDIDMERLIIREWGDRIDAWDHNSRNDDDYRKLFADLSGVLVLYQSIHVQ